MEDHVGASCHESDKLLIKEVTFFKIPIKFNLVLFILRMQITLFNNFIRTIILHSHIGSRYK